MTEERDEKLKEYFSWFNPFAVAVNNISKEFNIGSLLRTAHCAKVKEFFLIGERSFNTYASVSSEKWTKVNYYKTLDEFIEFVNSSDYNLILVEQNKNSESLFDFNFPQNPLFLFGTEKGGLPENILNLKYKILEIPQYGLVHSLNLSCSGSIVIYHYLYNLHKKNQLNSNKKNTKEKV